MPKKINILLICIILFCFCLLPTVRAQTTAAGANGVVASANKLASEIGIDILKAGGNAVDAAIAVHMALAVVHPQAGNIGGGGFFVIHLADRGISTTIDFRERAPLAGNRTMYLDAEGNVIEGASRSGHLASGVPGAVAGLWLAHQKYGSLPWKTLLAPAHQLADEGFNVDYYLARSFNRYREELSQHPETKEIFVPEGGWQAGERLVQRDLARTIDIIAEEGPEGFYSGEIAELIAAEMEARNGLISERDLSEYQAVERAPVTGTYRGYTILSMPPPSSGGALLVMMLNMLEPLNLKQLGFNSADYVHRIVEIEKRAYADRATHLGDSDFYPVPLEKITSKDYAQARAATISPCQATPSSEIAAGDLPTESEETTHFSVVDRQGNGVSCTTTLNSSYGSKVVVPGTGMLLNNQMDDFSIKPGEPNIYGLIGGEANAIEPGKRMLSSMTPTILLDDQGSLFMITGSPGGSTIITTVLQTIINVIDHEMPLARAVYSPRFHHQWLPDQISHEEQGISADTLLELVRRGHSLRQRSSIGDVHAVVRDQSSGLWLGVSDPRSGGSAESY